VEESSTPSQSKEPSLRQQAEELVDELSASEQAASLVMAGVAATGASAAEISAMKKQGISNVFLRGRSQLTVQQTAAQVRKITQSLESSIPGQLPVWVATDQEGGFVRVLQGAGFAELPTALKQGQWSTSKLEREVGTAGKQLAEAGINVNLAPVADVVPSSIGTSNAPIGYFGREYAHDAAGVSKAVATVNEVLHAQGVQPVVKHFPGLGRVAENTDTNTGVTDTKIGADSSDLQPFEQAIEQGKSWVMVSNARYARLDTKNDAPFSSKIITGLLRGQMGYDGIVISDDLCEAKQVGHVPVGERAVKFIAAGGTVPLCVNSAPAITMAKTLAAEAKSDGKFAGKLREAAALILEEKLRSQ
jgi:beta-N-acetylhexosaminidase